VSFRELQLIEKSCYLHFYSLIEVLPQVRNWSAKYEESVQNEFNVQISVSLANRKIRITGHHIAVAKCEDMLKNSWDAMLSTDAETIESSFDEKNFCKVCFECTTEYPLQECGHFYCLGCLKSYIRSKFSTLLAEGMREIKCLVTGCNSQLLIRDIKAVLGQAEMPKLAYSVFPDFLQNNREEFVECLGTDCRQVR
jgi:hypothetical protein